MERESIEDARHLIRAARSLIFNRKLEPLVNERLERAEAHIRNYLTVNDLPEKIIGVYQIKLDEKGDIQVSRHVVDEWRQLPLAPTEISRESNGVLGNIGAMIDSQEEADPQSNQGLFVDL